MRDYFVESGKNFDLSDRTDAEIYANRVHILGLDAWTSLNYPSFSHKLLNVRLEVGEEL